MVFNVVQQPECPVIDLDIGHSLPCTATQQVSTLSAPKLTCMCPFLGVVPGQLGRRIPAEFALLQMEFKHSRSLKLNESPHARCPKPREPAAAGSRHGVGVTYRDEGCNGAEMPRCDGTEMS